MCLNGSIAGNERTGNCPADNKNAGIKYFIKGIPRGSASDSKKINSLFMRKPNRRDFIVKTVAGGVVAVGAGCLLLRGKVNFLPGLVAFSPAALFSESPVSAASSPDAVSSSGSPSSDDPDSGLIRESEKTEITQEREAMYYTRLDRNRVQCDLCNRNCIIAQGRRGFCRNRENRRGTLYTVVYGRPSAVHIDPVEKEPQHHMLPGTEMLSLGTAGCNFRCLHCHNWHLSQRSIEEIGRYYDHPPRDVVNNALKLGVHTISSTYNEPTVFYEYVLDIARIARKENLRILWHSNGYINPDPLKELLQHTDAVTVDLKGFSRRAYDNSSAELEPVLTTLQIIKEAGVWLEIVNLVIPTINDSMQEIEEMCGWIRDNLSHEVPLHFSRFFPNYKLTHLSPTPVETLERAYKTAQSAGLHYVTLGNVPGHEYNSTFCPLCGKILIRRRHFEVTENNIRDGSCAFCGHEIPGIWS